MGIQPNEGDILGGGPVRQPGVPPPRGPGNVPAWRPKKLPLRARQCPTCGQRLPQPQLQPTPQQPDVGRILEAFKNMPRKWDPGLLQHIDHAPWDIRRYLQQG
jgi:hypothetical protein